MNRVDAQERLQQDGAAVVEALALLGKKRFALAIHDSCFPGLAGQDIGRGSPYSEGARKFLAFARGLGFNAIQFGPQGQTPRDNPSPYDGTLFSKNILNLDLAALAGLGDQAGCQGGLLQRDSFKRFVAACPSSDKLHSNHAYAFDTCHTALAEMYQHFSRCLEQGDAAALQLESELAAFSARQQDWLPADALYHALVKAYAGRHYRDWPVINEACPDRDLYRAARAQDKLCIARRAALLNTHQRAIKRYQLGQFLLHRQHAKLRAELNRWGLQLYADFQVGSSACDAWSRGAFYLDAYAMGAPPSRTNPDGQPWGYGVFDPDQYLDRQGAAGPVLQFLKARVDKLLAEFDGLRIDHPHGLVCPWVYRTADSDPHHAVQNGARLFSSPNLPEHPDLAHYTIARPEQLNTAVPRYADDWVQCLQPSQVERYALLLDTVVNTVYTHGAVSSDVLCEVLSTQPYPLARVLERQGLGRFRVTQKMDLDKPDDVYRSEHARSEDWIMVGNHDTAPIWRLARQWLETDQARCRAEYLAQRLRPEGEREAFVRALTSDRRKLVHAMLADIFASQAAHVMVFFPDLLGLEERYNRPGISDPDNWLLRVPPDYAAAYLEAAACGEALDLPCVLALALQARGEAFTCTHRELIHRLQRLVKWWDGELTG